jgi:hypothetical protein
MTCFKKAWSNTKTWKYYLYILYNTDTLHVVLKKGDNIYEFIYEIKGLPVDKI